MRPKSVNQVAIVSRQVSPMRFKDSGCKSCGEIQIFQHAFKMNRFQFFPFLQSNLNLAKFMARLDDFFFLTDQINLGFLV